MPDVTLSSGSGTFTTAYLGEGIDASSGVVGKSAYNLMCSNAATIANQQSASTFNYQAIAHGFLLALGAAKQYEAIEKQGNLADAQADAVARNIALTERTYEETFLPAYKESQEYFYKYYRKSWEPQLSKIAQCGTKDCEYTPDYTRWIGRGISDVAKVVGAARRASKRMLGPYSAGECCDQDYRILELQARMTTEVINFGRVYEDDLKLKKDTFYWNKQITVAQMIQNIGSLAANTMNSGKQSLAQGLQLQQQALSGFNAAVESGFSALSQAGNFYSGLGGLAGDFFGTQRGAEAGQGLRNTNTGLYGINPAPATNFGAGFSLVPGTPGSNNTGYTPGSPALPVYSFASPSSTGSAIPGAYPADTYAE